MIINRPLKRIFFFIIILSGITLFPLHSESTSKYTRDTTKKDSNTKGHSFKKSAKSSSKTSSNLFSRGDHSDVLLKNLAQGNYSDVYASLQNLDQRIEQGALTNPLYFLMGILAYKEGRFKTALGHFKKTYKQSTSLSDYIRYWIGKTYLHLNKPHKALGWLELPDKITRKIDADLFWERVHALIEASQWNETNELLKKRKKETIKNAAEQLKVLFYESKMAQAQNKKITVVKLWKRLLVKEAGNPFEEKIIQSLKKFHYSLDTFLSHKEWLARASRLIEVGLPREALKIYQKLSKKDHNLKEQIAYATFRARNYAKAARLYQDLWDHPQPGQNRLLTLLRLTSSYHRSDQFKKTLDYNRKIIKLFPKSKSARNARYKIGFIYFDSGQYQKAIEYFTDYLAREDRYKRKEALWNRLWAYYLTKNYRQTISELEELKKKERSKTELLRLAYWKARCLQKLGEKNRAREIYRQIVGKRKTHYYTFLAAQRLIWNRLDSHALVDTKVIRHIPSQGNIPHSDSWKNRVPRSDPLFRAISLAQIGLSDYAYNEAELSTLIKGGLSLNDITHALKAAHNYRRLASLGRRNLKVSPSSHDSYYYWTLAYPTAYPQWVETMTDRHQLDPLLAWSVMREESAFKPAVVSSAQAIGLMQMIPQTGKEVSIQLGREKFHSEDLADPLTNIEFGTWYLKRRLDEFGGNIIYAIASYNAGPEAVHRWKKWGNKLERDEFIELIPYRETNKYVKKVLKSYWIYQRLYGGPRIQRGT